MRQRLIDGGGEIAIEGRRRQQAGPGIEQAAGVDRAQRAAEMRLEGVLADQRQRVGGNALGLAGDDFEIGQIVGRRQRVRRQHDRQVAEARIFGQHGEEGIHHARAKTFAEHDAVDVAGVEMFRRGFDRERADHAHPLAKRDRKRGIGRAAADQQHGGVARRIGCPASVGARPDRRQAGASRSHAASGPAARRAAAPSGDRNCRRFARTEWHFRAASAGDRRRSAEDRACARRSASPAPRSRARRRRTARPEPRPAPVARPRATRRPRLASMTGNILASSSALRERRPPGIRHDNDRALLGHLKTRIDAID